MKRAIHKIWVVFRALALVMVALAVLLPAALYLTLSTPWAQQRMCDAAQSVLSQVLATDVAVGRVVYHPFNRIVVEDVSICDDAGQPAAAVGAINARFELLRFLHSGDIVVDYVVIDDLSLALSRASAEAPLNIQNILDKLKGSGEKKKTKWQLAINTVVLRRGSLSYDVGTAVPADSLFDKDHIRISDLQLYAYLPKLSDGAFDIRLEHLSFAEHSGFRLTDISAALSVDSTGIAVSDLNVSLPHSHVRGSATADINVMGGDKHLRGFTARLDDVKAYAPDLAMFVPALANVRREVNMHIEAGGTADAVTAALTLTAGSNIDVSLTGTARRSEDNAWGLTLDDLRARAGGADVAELMASFGRLGSKPALMLSRLGSVSIDASGYADVSHADILCNVRSTLGKIALDLKAATPDRYKHIKYDVAATADIAGLASLGIGNALESANMSLKAAGVVAGRAITGEADANIAALTLGGYTYRNIAAHAVVRSLTDADVSLSVGDDNLEAIVAAAYRKDHDINTLCGNVHVSHYDPAATGLLTKYAGYTLSGDADWTIAGSSLDDAESHLEIKRLYLVNNSGDGITMEHLDMALQRDAIDQAEASLSLKSDFLSGTLDGHLVPSTLVKQMKALIATAMPDLFPIDDATQTINDAEANDISFELSLSNAEELSEFFKLPMHVIYPVDITGEVSHSANRAYIYIDAPYLQQGDKIIDDTSLYVAMNGNAGTADVYATTNFPTKKGPLAANINITGADNRFDTRVDWAIARRIPVNGIIDFSTTLGRSDAGSLITKIDINPSAITFGDDIWHFEPAMVAVNDGKIHVKDFKMVADSQTIAIDGDVSQSSDDELEVHLKQVTIGDIFETLEIDKALIGGVATGNFTASALLSKSPVIVTDDLHVKDISYNYCVLGDADIKAHFDNEKQSVALDADVVSPEGRHSYISGDIIPAGERLDLTFDADHVKVGFLKPFMAAFAQDIQGYASGKAHLFGTFKYIDLEGDLLAHSVKIKIDFTNTWYEAADSVHIRPGIIDLKDITVKDVHGNTALLNGYVKHTFFKEPVFDFKVTQARNLLCYDVGPKQSPDWYGTIYGNGSATVSGEPGVVNIGVNMTTAPHSTFTFVLSDRLDANEYSFITFRDVTPRPADIDTLITVSDVPEAVLEFQRRMQAKSEDAPSAYNMDFYIDITRDAEMIIVMDPVGGDRIKATGNGNLRMTYGSADNDLRMYGSYELDNGSYNFTLQDIIIKDFTIKDGSSITFRGDPYSAQLDINAVYAVNANLSDLDESFLQDKELNRTNVPVHALLKVKGDMRQPDIGFDLEFPTLNSDTYRKVRSIISTDEMMNRQIIYLLALNRFYTPDYVASTTKGNELFSVASSTISSQLSSMLGKISDKWSIAPNLRSDRGDFSDVEVDVMLSSRLLNNRLLFNGNFGYRDKSLNTNQFIGDFDIEYLLNRQGTLRLKAYNRYNDQNYYVRTAQTTQGVGIMLKHDFDNIFSFLHRKKKPSPASESERGDSIETTDSISVATPASVAD